MLPPPDTVERPFVSAEAFRQRCAASKVRTTTDHAALRTMLLVGGASGAAGGALALLVLFAHGLLRKRGPDARYSRVFITTTSVCVPMLVGCNVSRLFLHPPNEGRGTGSSNLAARQTPLAVGTEPS